MCPKGAERFHCIHSFDSDSALWLIQKSRCSCDLLCGKLVVGFCESTHWVGRLVSLACTCVQTPPACRPPQTGSPFEHQLLHDAPCPTNHGRCTIWERRTFPAHSSTCSPPVIMLGLAAASLDRFGRAVFVSRRLSVDSELTACRGKRSGELPSVRRQSRSF